MGAFDVLIVPRKCEGCQTFVQSRCQFKYGTPWQREFSFGDELTWESKPIRWNGQPMTGLISVDAEIEPCPVCEFEYEFSIVYIDDGRFIGAGRNGERFRFKSDEYATAVLNCLHDESTSIEESP
ncbi:hypothetical protein K7W42_13895 [Deinococcus sp. HMF7604]|uniref:hypothetical protein n=1 Tax=Deinococcus betulae TaxID=2873312 RepID=UPI001CCD5928|nr:hypothetical protein [Deinococcus betulae]MBZ9751948.1 hypothetical protein [Deinococcus betulae]